jgi:hypothetical protein
LPYFAFFYKEIVLSILKFTTIFTFCHTFHSSHVGKNPLLTSIGGKYSFGDLVDVDVVTTGIILGRFIGGMNDGSGGKISLSALTSTTVSGTSGNGGGK